VVFLALFVKYAWENDWVGPSGRVLIGTATGVALVAAGLRLREGRYRPLGQGLAGTGLAGLYLSAFAAHAFYDLIPRAAAGLWMGAITLVAVLLAVRLDVRLMAALAWIGGYLTPVLLSTGEDKALALFAYLALLDAGALVLDRRRPWPETAPLAMAGTFLLYTGWYATFFTPARFNVAAFGLVLFTALFVLGLAAKERKAGTWATLLLAAMGMVALAAMADRPVPLLLLAVALSAAGLFLARRGGLLFAGLSLVGGFAPLLAWGAAHYRAEAFGIAAAWSVALLLLFLLRPQPVGESAAAEAAPSSDVLMLAALGAAGIAAASMAGSTDRPWGLALFLLAEAGVAIVARRRERMAELVGLAGTALTVSVWASEFFKDGRQLDLFKVALPAAAAYLFSLLARGLVRRLPLTTVDVFAHAGVAALVWGVLFRGLYDSAPGTLALASVALAAFYLVLGLATVKEQPELALQVRAFLGLAAVFVTLAIPVKLGLHGITLAWAFEGVVLLALALRYGSALGRLGAYLVLGLALVRLFGWHTLIRTSAAGFTPVLNPVFGTWLAVIGALAVAALLVRRSGSDLALDRVVGVLLPVAALLLLFGLFTSETKAGFEQMARRAVAANDMGALEQASLRGRLALSVLWTLFSTGLLAGGLGLRNRPLFYAAYGLFAVTALKVVFVDLATLHTVYRMLSFLALGLLLLAGAYLNLRFRERMMPREAAS